MYRIAIFRHNGLFYGGTEKFLQIMAAEVNHNKFEVDYYTTNMDASPDREQYLIDHDVNVIHFDICDYPWPLNKLKSTWSNLWKNLKVDDYDVVQSTNFGWDEYPYNSLGKANNLCEFTVFPPYVKFNGVQHHILNSEWLRQQWIKSGGSENISTAIPVPCKIVNNDNLRSKLGIDKGVTVCGFHQRADDRIFSPIQLQAYKNIEDEFTHMIVLNGSKLYREQAKQLNIKHITFLDYADEVSSFLNTLDIYTHGRKDGETYGMVLAEAMLHKLPCISHSSPNYNAMKMTIGRGGVVVDNVDQYTMILNQWIENDAMRNLHAFDGQRYALANYSYEAVIPKIESVWESLI
jgi:glycosyltransferase involved in cell wall biosynthesis